MIGSIEAKTMKEKFIELLKETERENIENLINLLETSDFFIAPASTNYHGNYKYGLLEHSLKVYENMRELLEIYEVNISKESVIIISLLHDICKMNFYRLEKRNAKKKDDNGNFVYINNKPVWGEIESYVVNDTFPIGHGEKSVIVLQEVIKLQPLEIMAIRWHMMSYDDVTKGYAGNLTLTNALNAYPIIALTHMADLASISLEVIER